MGPDPRRSSTTGPEASDRPCERFGGLGGRTVTKWLRRGNGAERLAFQPWYDPGNHGSFRNQPQTISIGAWVASRQGPEGRQHEPIASPYPLACSPWPGPIGWALTMPSRGGSDSALVVEAGQAQTVAPLAHHQIGRAHV